MTNSPLLWRMKLFHKIIELLLIAICLMGLNLGLGGDSVCLVAQLTIGQFYRLIY